MEADYFELHNEDNILDWCCYCHSAIHVGETYVTAKEGLYHCECFEIKGRYYSTFYFDDEEN